MNLDSHANQSKLNRFTSYKEINHLQHYTKNQILIILYIYNINF